MKKRKTLYRNKVDPTRICANCACGTCYEEHCATLKARHPDTDATFNVAPACGNYKPRKEASNG